MPFTKLLTYNQAIKTKKALCDCYIFTYTSIFGVPTYGGGGPVDLVLLRSYNVHNCNNLFISDSLVTQVTFGLSDEYAFGIVMI